MTCLLETGKAVGQIRIEELEVVRMERPLFKEHRLRNNRLKQKQPRTYVAVRLYGCVQILIFKPVKYFQHFQFETVKSS